MSNYSKKDLDYFANKTLENYDSKNPSLIFKEKIKICIYYELYSDYTGILFQYFFRF